MFHEIRWTSQKIKRRLEEIQALEYQKRQALTPFFWKELEGDAQPFESIDEEDDWKELQPHQYWGKPRINFVFRTNFHVPPSWNRNETVALYLPLGVAGDFSHPGALVYIDGEPYASCDRHHQEIILPKRWCDGEAHTLRLHGWTGIGGSTVGDPHKSLQMGECEIVQIHAPTRDFLAIARVASGIADQLDDANPARHHLYSAVNDAIRDLDMRIPLGETFYNSVPAAIKTLQQGVELAGVPLAVDITAVGHAHLDVAWLWTLAQTRQKAARSFYTVIRLMEQYPEFHFAQSQPQLYDFILQDFPELFNDITQRVAEGRWEVLGGMWVEADCNLSGSESLARQFTLGRKFFRQHFGKEAESPVLWLPDVFGYAWNLPQLIKSAGLEYFFTIKIGWSQYNRLPYDSFWWQGLDGTRILTHFSTTKNPKSIHAATYNSDASPGQTLGTWLNFQQKDHGPPGITPPLLMSFGWGDGGGGPTREMLDNLRIMSKFPGTPQIKPGSVAEFFAALDDKMAEHLPVWNGELYLEYHRGTYTTQARIKQANRKSEFNLHDTEFLATLAMLIGDDYRYPSEDFENAWKLLCLNQFHDIITGTSIRAVYEDAEKHYRMIGEICQDTRQDALMVIREHFGGDFLVINPSSFVRSELAFWSEELPNGKNLRMGDSLIAIQPVENGVLLELDNLPPYSVTPLMMDNNARDGSTGLLMASPSRLENDHLVVDFDSNGDIERIYDKTNDRDVLREGQVTNQFQAFEDRPLSWDAWDIDVYYDEKMWLSEPASSIKVIESGPLRATIEIHRRILNSDYIQHISLTHNSPRLDFNTRMNWQERKILLKTAFPVDILAPKATYEIQWGNVERPTHRNTSWDWARFETAAQKWVDLSEGGYGVSLLNDCKYGHDIHENVIRLTLLRGTTAPDPTADLGEHQFLYSLFPHKDKWGIDTVATAYAINDPLIVIEGSRLQPRHDHGSLISCQQKNVIIETIKRAEDGDGIIIRLFDCLRMRSDISLKTSFRIEEAWLTNLIEENQERLQVDGKLIHLSIKPFQILTLRIIPNKYSSQILV